MKLPLYNHEFPTEYPEGGHAGLWWERFFSAYDEKQDWKIDPNNEGTAKADWIFAAAGSCGDREQLHDHALRTLGLLRDREGAARAFKVEGYFTTGLGLPHPVENGFAWHPTLAVPYLTGAAVKGLLKAWMERLAEGLSDGGEPADNIIQRWFGTPEHAGGLIFFDALPTSTVILKADVMTPHMGKWYEQGHTIDDLSQSEKIPGDWHDPTPVPFLVVTEATFLFSITRRPAGNCTKDDVDLAFKELADALRYAGAGAKTDTGYGRMSPKKASLETLNKELEKQRPAPRPETPPLDPEIQQLLDDAPPDQPIETTLFKALGSDQEPSPTVVKTALELKSRMQGNKRFPWRETSAKKKPSRDTPYQMTRRVLAVLKAARDTEPTAGDGE